MQIIVQYLKNHGVTCYKVAQISGVSEGTLAMANKSDISSLQVKTLSALGMATA